MDEIFKCNDNNGADQLTSAPTTVIPSLKDNNANELNPNQTSDKDQSNSIKTIPTKDNDPKQIISLPTSTSSPSISPTTILTKDNNSNQAKPPPSTP